MSGHAFTIGGLSDGNYGSGNVNLQDNAGNAITLSVGDNNQSTTYSGYVGGPLGSSLEKIGSGTLTLGGPINAGTVIVSSGTLALAAPGILQTGAIVNGGILQLNDPQAAEYGTVTVNVDNGLAFGPGVTAPLSRRPGRRRRDQPRHHRLAATARHVVSGLERPVNDLLRHHQRQRLANRVRRQPDLDQCECI